MKKNALVILLGDIEQSPRTYNNVKMLLEHINVYLICEIEEDAIPRFKNDGLEIYKIPRFPSVTNSKNIFFRTILYILKIIYLSSILVYYGIFCTDNIDFIMVQSPPNVPIVYIAKIISIWKNSKLIVDWHNLAFTLMNKDTFLDKIFYHIASFLEHQSMRITDKNIAVTRKLKEYVEKYNENTILFKDYPLKKYDRCTYDEIKNISSYLCNKYSLEILENSKIITCPTSWTWDEDLDLLERFLDINDIPVTIFITGKCNNDRDKKIFNKKWKNAIIYTIWLEYSDYIKLLRISDYGLSLHKSSSGLDFPMKIVDMVGVGIPCISLRFPNMENIISESHIIENEEDLYHIIKNLRIQRDVIKIKNIQRWNDIILCLFK